MDGAVVFGAFEPQPRTGRERDGDAGLVADTRPFPVAFADVFPVFGDTAVEPERLIDGGILGEAREAEGEEQPGDEDDKEQRRQSLGAKPSLARERFGIRHFLRALFLDEECREQDAREKHIASQCQLEDIVEIARLTQSVGENDACGEPDEQDDGERLLPIETRREIRDAAERQYGENGEGDIQRIIAGRQTKQGERWALQGDEQEGVERDKRRQETIDAVLQACEKCRHNGLLQAEKWFRIEESSLVV